MKWLKRIILTLLVLFLLVAGTLLVIAFAYENEVKDYMIQQLNKHLKTQVIADGKNIHLSLLKSFPYASLEFKDVKMLESCIGKNAQKRDTLFALEKIYLEFNLFDILKKNYVVKKIKAESGKIKLKMAVDGTVNWDVWKSADTTSSQEGSAFNLEKFQLSNIELQYLDHKNKNNLAFKIHSGKIGGEFKSKQYDLSVTGDLLAHHFKLDSINYADEEPVKLDFNLKVDNEKNSYEFSNALLTLSDLKISVEGKYINEDPQQVDISLKGKDMNIRSVLSLLPEKYKSNINDYNSDGDFFCNAHIYGKWDATSSPELKADFGISKADIKQISSGLVLKNTFLIGNYFSSHEKDFLDINAFTTSFENGNIAGNFRIDNFSSPFAAMKITADFPLEDVRHFLKIDTLWNYPIESLGGNMKLNMEYKGQLKKSNRYHKADFEKMNLAGDVKLENAKMKIKNSSLAFDSINGSFVLNDNDIEINSFSAKTPKSDFELKGFLKNILGFSLTDEEDVNIDASFHSKNFNLDEFLVNHQQTTKRDTVYKIHFSPRINFDLRSNIGHLTFRKFEAANIQGNFQLKNQKLIADPLSFSSMDGTVSASGMIDNTIDSTLLITCNANLKELNIRKLFYEFEDFGQNTISYNHLQGTMAADVEFASVWKSDLTIDEKRIYARSNMLIEKGELIKFEPLKALSKYISVSELEDIKFSTLQNQIEVKDKKVFIPKMNIQSSALNVSLSGIHGFDNSIDYHFKVLMNDVLFQKARKAKKENNEFGVVEDDKSGRTSLFISMTGTVDNPIIKYDKQGAKQQLKENIAEEKHTLKQILKDEFGWFKKDTTLNKKEKPKNDGKFIIKWDEDEKEKPKKEDDDF